jgi:hypothetical protein
MVNCRKPRCWHVVLRAHGRRCRGKSRPDHCQRTTHAVRLRCALARIGPASLSESGRSCRIPFARWYATHRRMFGVSLTGVQASPNVMVKGDSSHRRDRREHIGTAILRLGVLLESPPAAVLHASALEHMHILALPAASLSSMSIIDGLIVREVRPLAPEPSVQASRTVTRAFVAYSCALWAPGASSPCACGCRCVLAACVAGNHRRLCVIRTAGGGCLRHPTSRVADHNVWSALGSSGAPVT